MFLHCCLLDVCDIGNRLIKYVKGIHFNAHTLKTHIIINISVLDGRFSCHLKAWIKNK